MKNWSFYVKIGLFIGINFLLMASDCNPAQSPGTASPERGSSPAVGLNSPAKQDTSPLLPGQVPKEVGQGAAADQVQVDSLKAAAARERAKNQGKKPKQ